VVSRDRPSGARLLETIGTDVIIMDDGFQNPSLQKDFSLIVVDAGAGIGSGRVFPLGPLRAPLDFQAKMADAILILKGEARSDGASAVMARLDRAIQERDKDLSKLLDGRVEPGHDNRGASNTDVFEARVVPVVLDGMCSQPVLAFCGIGRPAKFFATLQQAGITAVKTYSFPDHHPFSEAEARSLLAEAKALGAGLLTTEKDRARLAGTTGARRELYLASQTLPITVEFAEGSEARLTNAIFSRIAEEA
jgi:tetraacyldisaccharide 4'-kinase